ncbi:MAG: RluA family pseudouridine synthase [Cyclobacteriaceae bacterium]|nr:RluA family pseudouridine synthase [Cyclobacteriaceae bacterium]
MSEENYELDQDELYEHHRIIADPGQGPVRVDKFLMDRLPNASRNKIQQAIKQGYIKINGEQVKANYKIKAGDDISVLLPEPPRDDVVIPENIPLDIVYEDKSILIVNKPAGMVVHPAYQNWSGTLVNALAWHFNNLPEMKGNAGRPGLVHRIDKDTSGLLVIAKTEKAMSHLALQFYEHSIERTYYALVWGEPDPPKGTIHVNVGRSFKDRRITVAFPENDFGRNAITHYEVLTPLRYVSLIKCTLETGRTHQIRAHMKYLGHTLFNDATYGGDKLLKGTQFSKYKSFVENCFKILPRQALHAKSLGFIHPDTGEKMYFESELPKDFSDVIEKWQHYVNFN